MLLTERLKNDTHCQHEALEKIPIVARQARGELPLTGYIEILKQLYLAHAKLEELMEEFHNNSRIAACYHAYHPRRDRALSDIRYFEPDLKHADLAPNPGVKKLMDLFQTVATSKPENLLGAFYVFEGSNFGAAFLVKIFQQTYNLKEAGISYYLGHKQELKPRWDNFKAAINSAFSDEREHDEVVEIACQTFQYIGEMYEKIDYGKRAAKKSAGK
jgi:heme oxygenase